MYFPYMRGRQYELLALRELAINNLLGNHVIPIVEPVKLSSTLIKTMAEYIRVNHGLSIIMNPSVGSFLEDWARVKKGSKEAEFKEQFSSKYNNPAIIKSVIMQDNAIPLIEQWEKSGVNKASLLVINTERKSLELYEQIFGSITPRYALVPGERTFMRRVRQHKVLLSDKFKRQKRNADYQKESDRFFSDDHLYYRDDEFIGFSDYSVIGNEFLETGFAPYAVVIHIVYFASDKSLRIKHFVSDSNEDITNPAKKFYEAVSKLAEWYNIKPHPVTLTLGLQTLLEHYNNKTYPGLGTVKKLSLMHHIELMGRYLSEVG